MNLSSSLLFNETWSWSGWAATIDHVAYAGAIDTDGSVVLVGLEFQETDQDFAAVKLSYSGDVLWRWTELSEGDGPADIWWDVDTDSKNDVIIGGRTEGYWEDPENYIEYDATINIAAVKLDGKTGDVRWRYQDAPVGIVTSNEEIIWRGLGTVSGVNVDKDDNVFLVGQVYGNLESGEGDLDDSDAFVIKLDGTDGSEIWRKQWGNGSVYDLFGSVKTDPDGDIIVAGHSGQKDSVDYIVLKLSGETGDPMWTFAPPSTLIEVLESVDLDAKGDVYVAGGSGLSQINDTSGSTPVVLKLNGSTRDIIWDYYGTAPSPAYFYSVGVDPVTGAVVGAGSTEGTWKGGAQQGGTEDFAAVVLNGTTGEELSRYQGGTNGTDYLTFGGFDAQGGLFVAGTSSIDGDYNMVAIRFGDPLEPPQDQGSSTWWESTRDFVLDYVEAGEDYADDEPILFGVAVGLLVLVCMCCCRCCCYRRCKRKSPRPQPNPTPRRPASPQEPPPPTNRYIRPQVSEERPPSPPTYPVHHPKTEPPPSTIEYERRHQQVVEKKELADQAYRSGSYQRAISLFSEAIELVGQRDTETKANLLANRAAARTNLGRNEDAVRDCDQALYLKPDYPKVLLRKGRLHSRLGQWDLAIQALETCRNSTTALPETVREATSELEQCRKSKREAQDEEDRRKREAEEKKKEMEAIKRLRLELRPKGHYDTLGVARTADASEIREAYKKLAKVHHPDKNDGDLVAAERFKAISRAYEVLRKPAERRAYDATL